jgi:uncharacterized protein YabE (DUF348 family)
MKSLTHQSILIHGIIFAAVCLLVFLVGIVFVPRVQAATPGSGQRLITIHDGDQTKGVLTRAATLRQVFEESHIAIDSHDRVEPGLDETLVASHYEINVYRARPVIIADGAIRTKIMTPYVTAKQIASDAHITLRDEDITTIAANTNMVSEGAGVQLAIKRATQFNLVFYGTKTDGYTQAKTVGEMLKQKNITLGADDTLSVPADAPITANMTIELWRNGKQTATAEQPVAFETEKINDVDQPVGYRLVRTPGIPGKKTVTFEIEMKNGVEVARKEIQSVVTQQPVKQVEVVGTKMTNTFNGSFAEALARLRSCEAGGVYTRNSGNGYYGAYQYNISTWADYGGYHIPSDAPPAVQDEKAWLTYQRRAWQPWPACSVKLGLQDIYR